MTTTARADLWFQALNPLIYTAAVIPVLVGTTASYAEAPTLFKGTTFAWVLAGVVLLQAWLNITNDVYDAETGVDVNKPSSLVNLTGQSMLLQIIAWSCLALGMVCIYIVNANLADNWILGIAGAGIGLGYCYQGPPFRFSYRGWGEPMTFIAFGPLSTLAASYAQLGRFSPMAFGASLVVGCLVTGIIFAHHFPQVADDQRAGKRSPVVQWGSKRASRVYPWVVLPAYGITVGGVWLGILPLTALLFLVSLPLALRLVTFLWQNHEGAASGGAMPLAVGLHALGGALLAVGLWGAQANLF
ncbi:DHNA phythltransferase [Gloeomargarita lithophora Alchichica-D10]|uniref:2-carboxy-1,4-naphthoquinone phytyltransferase n=1 Tax=Gloeomargarita lithophora Alchichica-D10 TaxID=1188229 RepID=A0A1J0AFI5_9CYAN|nr:2-carboxy-1,4-naphthoquinone phytyltransferase [Gloeomargarita lithophora]APB34679.1 DHNA phythltransferase [Gloeomargarita lithophora Alchichica-D10]